LSAKPAANGRVRQRIDHAAVSLLISAHGATYQWPVSFLGFKASVQACWRGGEVRGQVEMVTDVGTAFVPDHRTAAPGEIANNVIATLDQLMPRPLVNAKGRVEARFGTGRESPVAIEMIGDPARTVYRLDGVELIGSEYHHRGAFHQVMYLARQQLKDGRWLPAITGELVTSEGHTTCRDIVDEWVIIRGVPMPARRTIVADRATATIEVSFTDHTLLRKISRP
jgi:hypothetical protein